MLVLYLLGIISFFVSVANQIRSDSDLGPRGMKTIGLKGTCYDLDTLEESKIPVDNLSELDQEKGHLVEYVSLRKIAAVKARGEKRIKK